MIARLLLVLAPLLIACSKPQLSSEKNGANEVVFVLHGFGDNKAGIWPLASRLEDAGFTVYRIGYTSIGRTPEEIQRDVYEQIQAKLKTESRTVHFVGHSFGGLLIRSFLSNHSVRTLGRVVLIGTPNKGTALVDMYHDSWWMKILGKTAMSLGTDSASLPNSLSDPYYPVGVIAGLSDGLFATHILSDPNDNVVPVESASLNGMADMIVIRSSHAMLRFDREVSDQTITFLRSGSFARITDP